MPFTRRAFAATLLAASAATSAPVRLKVRIKNRIEQIDLEHYTAAVLTGESSVFHSTEALKAMAVAARTYAAHFIGRHAPEGFDLCDTTHCQRYDPTQPNERVIGATRETTGQVLLYQGNPALAYYALDCGGRTEDVRNAWPGETATYLTSHTDPYCQRNAHPGWHWEADSRQLTHALQSAGLQTPAQLHSIAIQERTASGRAKTLVLIGNNESIRLSATSLRFAVGRSLGFNTVQSDLYQVASAGTRILYNGTGVGHGVGLCQRGADQMGADGHTYRDILAFYFPGTALAAPASSPLSWTRISGERLALFTTQPTQDGPILATAERLLREAEARIHAPAPNGIALRLYPTIAAFIGKTGEPGWVAAQTFSPAQNGLPLRAGSEIHLQPRRTLEEKHALESTLRHELTHVVIDARAKPGLPIWFREGLAEHISSTGNAASARHASPDRDLRQTASQPRARAAYADALARVSTLVDRYGETAVLGWLSTGLPREVTNANSNPPATNKR